MDIDSKIPLSDNQDKSNKDNTDKGTDINQKNLTINEGINMDKIDLDVLDSKFKNSIEEFIKKLNSQLIDVSISTEQKKALEDQIEGMARRLKEIPINKMIQNDLSTDSVQSFSQDNNKPIPCDHKEMEINPENADAYNNKGISLYYSGKYNEAIECYDKALEINPDYAQAYYNKGIILSVNGYNSEAIECYDKALEINPQNADAYYNKGLSLSILKNYPEAIECYDKALEINPQNADAYYNKGLSLSALKNYPEAIECYDKALEIQSDNVNALNKKAWDLANHFPSRLQEASETIKKAVGLDPTNINIVHTYGYILDRLQTYKEAIIVYEHIMKQSPAFSNVWYDCARSKIKLDGKNIENCISDLQKAIELNPVYREKAKHESDFEFIKNNPEFKRIIEV
ncbi:MAG: tetratricopeptide repeat protein [Nitrosopumilus sp.]|nr:tetratricopeptide repeat protein [Nitrosopumilus sp.]